MKLYEIAKHISGVVIGDGQIEVLGLSPIENISANHLVYVDGQENQRLAEQSEASAIVVGHLISSSAKPLIRVEKPSQAFIQLIDLFYPKKEIKSNIHQTAVIGQHVQLGKNVSIGPFVAIDEGSIIGDNCVIKSHVVIGRDVKIGQDVT